MNPIEIKELLNRMEIERNAAGDILTQFNRKKEQLLSGKEPLNGAIEEYTMSKNKLQAELIRNNALGIIKRVEQLRKAASLIQTLRQLTF